MSRVLVTGGAGFIGSNFIRRLLAADPNVTVTNLDLLTYAGVGGTVDELNALDRHELVLGDIRDRSLVDSLVAGADAVVHFAAESHVDRSIAGPEVFLSTNVVGTGVLLDAAVRHRVSRFVHVSTDEVYGPIASGSAGEQAPLRPSSPYAASKAAADLLVEAYRTTYGYEAVITRSTNNYGPYQHPEKLIPLAITKLLAGDPIPIYGDGRQERDWLWVDDHCAALHLLLDDGEPGEIYNIGADTQTRNIDVADSLIEIVGFGLIAHIEDRPGHDRRYAIDSTKVRNLGWRPTVGLEEGLERTVAWYRDRRDWWAPLVAEA